MPGYDRTGCHHDKGTKKYGLAGFSVLPGVIASHPTRQREDFPGNNAEQAHL